MNRVGLKVVLTDDDGMLQLDVSVSNGRASASMEVYSYPADVLAFAAELGRFPTGDKTEVVWESGSAEPRWYGHMRLRAYVLDGSGHSAIDVLMDVRQDPPSAAHSRFSIRCNPADLNELGRRITAWIETPTEPLEAEWPDA